jgi:YgiT-type zinc finger domain-containing protein
MITGTADLNFSRNGLTIRVKNVPAFVCTRCNNKTLTANVAIYIDQIVQTLFETEQPIRVRELVLEAA